MSAVAVGTSSSIHPGAVIVEGDTQLTEASLQRLNWLVRDH